MAKKYRMRMGYVFDPEGVERATGKPSPRVRRREAKRQPACEVK